MPRPRPPHVHRTITRHGKVAWYYHEPGKPRIRLRAAYGSPEWQAELDAAREGRKPSEPAHGTLLALWTAYRQTSAEWSQFSPATRRQRENVMHRVCASAGGEMARDITPEVIRQGLDRRKDTPSAARHFLESLRGLFRWAHATGLVSIDPTKAVKPPKNETKGFHVWTEAEMARFEAHWPSGTAPRLAYDILLFTGLRRGDAVRLGRQHIERSPEGDIILIATEKTGEIACIPITPPLRRVIDAIPRDRLTFLVGSGGGNLTKESFGNYFRRWCQEAGVPGSAHGLRKAGATRLAEHLTESQLEAIYGWERGSGMTAVYTRTINRKKAARQAGRELEKAGAFSHHPQGAKAI